MPEFLLGDVTARIRADISQFTQALTEAHQRLQAFAQTASQTAQTQAGAQAATNQLASAYLVLARSISEQTRTWGAAQTAALAYTSGQEQVRNALLAQQQAQRAATEEVRRAAAVAQTEAAQALTRHRDAIAAAQQALAQQRQAAQAASQAAQAQSAAQQQAAASLRGLTQAQSESSEATQRWARILDMAAGVGIATSVQAIIAQVFALGKAMVDTAVQFEQARVGMAALSGGSIAGAAVFQTLIDLGQRLGYNVLSLADAFRQLTGATRGTALAGADTQKVFEAVVTAARAFGSSQQDVDRAILALSQIVSKGVVSMEELRRQLGDALPGAFQIAARAMGVSTAELEKMVRTGQLSAVPFVQAFARQLQFELAPAARLAGDTTAAAFARLRNEISLAAEALANSGILQALRAISSTAAAALKDIRVALQSGEQVRTIYQQESLLGTGMRMGEIGAPQLQRLGELQQRIDVVRRSLVEWNRLLEQQPSLASDAELGRQRQELANLEAQKAALLASQQTIKQTKDAEAAVAAEKNKQLSAQERLNDAQEQSRKSMEEYRQALRDLQQNAAQFPAQYGRPEGTLEEQQRYAAELQKLQASTVEKLAEIRRRAPEGLGTPEMAGWAQELNSSLEETRLKVKAAQEAVRDLKQELKEGPPPGSTPDQVRAWVGEQATRLQREFQRQVESQAQMVALGSQEVGRPTGRAEDQVTYYRHLATEITQTQRAIRESIVAFLPRELEPPKALTDFLGDLNSKAAIAKERLNAAEQALRASNTAVRQHATDMEKARTVVAGYGAELSKIQAYVGVETPRGVEDAVAKAETEGARIKASFIAMQEALRLHPEFRKDAGPEMVAFFEQPLSAIDAAIQRHVSDAAAQASSRLRGLAAALEGAIERANALVESSTGGRAEQAAQRVRDRFREAEQALRQGQETLVQEPALGAARPELAGQAEASLAALRAQVDRASQQAATDFTLRLRGQLQGLGSELAQLQEKLGVAGTDPMTRGIATIRQAYEELDGKIATSLTALERLRPQVSDPAEQAQLEAMIAGYNALTQAERDAARARDELAFRSRGGTEMLGRLESQLTGLRQRAPLEALLQQAPSREFQRQLDRARAEGMGPEQETQIQALRRHIQEQQNLNRVVEALGQISTGVTDVFVNGLMNIIMQTQNVGEAFKAMGKTMLDTVAKITLDTGFRMLISMGLTALGGAIMGGTGTSAGTPGPWSAPWASAGTVPGIDLSPMPTTYVQAYQHGGVVLRPTIATLGERGPEAVVNRQQMGALMDFARTSSRAGTGSQTAARQPPVEVTTILVDNRMEAQRIAARERGMGKNVIIQEVLRDLAAGSGSHIGRAIRMVQ